MNNINIRLAAWLNNDIEEMHCCTELTIYRVRTSDNIAKSIALCRHML